MKSLLNAATEKLIKDKKPMPYALDQSVMKFHFNAICAI